MFLFSSCCFGNRSTFSKQQTTKFVVWWPFYFCNCLVYRSNKCFSRCVQVYIFCHASNYFYVEFIFSLLVPSFLHQEREILSERFEECFVVTKILVLIHTCSPSRIVCFYHPFLFENNHFRVVCKIIRTFTSTKGGYRATLSMTEGFSDSLYFVVLKFST